LVSDGAWSGHQEYDGNTFSFSRNIYSQKIKATDTTYQYSGTFTIYTGKPCEFANEQTLIKFNNDEYANSFSIPLLFAQQNVLQMANSSTKEQILVRIIKKRIQIVEEV
jgi:hypothetical protein